jgi:hypothetical protein
VSNGDDAERAAESNAFFGGEATPEATGHHDFLETKVVGGTRRRSPGFFVMQQGALLEIA